MQDKLDYIREKCIEANPSIKDLVFGCRVLDEVGVEERVLYFQDHWKGYKQVKLDGTAIMLNVSDLKEILGRDIRLADVLLALNEFVEQRLFITPDGCFCTFEENIAIPDELYWNLYRDRLEDQSPETIEFIYNLLKNEA